MFALVHDTFERSQKEPVVRHVFVGRDRDQALGYYEAHRRSDRFMKDCDDRGLFDGRVACSTRKNMQKVSPRQLRALAQGQLAGAQQMPVRELSQTECPVSFWRFAGPVTAGQLGALGVGFLVRDLYRDSHPKTKESAATIAGIATFWIITGIGWLIANRRPVTPT